MRTSCQLFFICLVCSQLDFSTADSAHQTCETPQFVHLQSEGIVHCNFSGDYFGIYWYNSTDYIKEFPIIEMKNSEKEGPGLKTKEFDMYPNGSLVIRKVRFDHASNYTAVKLNSADDPIIPHFVTVIVQALPSPPYPVIEECEQRQSCIMAVGREGNLTCSVRGIFPSVDLEWTKFEEDSPITFSRNHTHKTKATDDRFHVSLTSSFYLNMVRGFKTTVTCRVIDHTKASKFDLSSQVVLFFTDADRNTNPTVGTTTKGSPVTAIVVTVVTVAVVITIVSLAVLGLRMKVSRRNGPTYTTVETGLSGSKNESEGLLSRGRMVSDKVEIFKRELKSAYQENFNGKLARETITVKEEIRVPGEAVITTKEEILGSDEELKDPDNLVEEETLKPKKAKKNKSKNISGMSPIPTEVDDSVNTYDTAKMNGSLEVDPTIQHMILKRGSGTHAVWKTVGSITDVLTDDKIASKYFIIEGEFGWETSNISRQLVCEWSQREDSPLAKHYDILILLKLDQISGNTPINSEIKRLLLKADSSITEEDVEAVLSNHHKICLLLDGFNTYANYECNNNSDVSKIIRREMFNDSTIILITSYSCVPNDPKEGVTRLRANDLQESDQQYLLSKELALIETDIGQQVRTLVKGNVLLKDILKVPFFFSIFLSMVITRTNIPTFKSVTSFFAWIISEMFSHCPKNHYGKLKSYCKDEILAELGKMAFESLTVKQKRDKTWDKTEVCARLGDSAYQFYRDIGILKESVIPQWDSISAQLKNDERVRFSHLLFSEWYVARHLLNIFANQDTKYMEGVFKILMSKDHWYCIRFLCGIRDNIADEVVEVLEVLDQLVLKILCKLEVENNSHNADDDIRRWSSKQVSLCTTDSKVQQAATVQLLEVASKKELLDLKLHNCFNSVEGFNGLLELTSGLQLPVLENLKNLHIMEEGREVTNEEATGILRFAFKSSKLKDVKFFKCILPQTLDGMNRDDITKWRSVTVDWTPNTDSSPVLCLDWDSFMWKKQRGNILDDYEYRRLVEEFRKNYRCQKN